VTKCQQLVSDHQRLRLGNTKPPLPHISRKKAKKVMGKKSGGLESMIPCPNPQLP
jgi:hypothetical protein